MSFELAIEAKSEVLMLFEIFKAFFSFMTKAVICSLMSSNSGTPFTYSFVREATAYELSNWNTSEIEPTLAVVYIHLTNSLELGSPEIVGLLAITFLSLLFAKLSVTINVSKLTPSLRILAAN